MKEARIELKIKNNILYTEIMKHASNVRQFCLMYGFKDSEVGMLVGLRMSPRTHNGWRKISKRLAEILRVLIEDLFPASLYALEKTEVSIEVSVEELSIDNYPALMIESPEDQFIRKEMVAGVEELVSILTPQEHDVIYEQYGLNEDRTSRNLREIGERCGLTKERIRQIEVKGMKKLRTRAQIEEWQERYL